MKFSVITLGCKVNAYESEIIKEKLLSSNFIYDEANPDIIIINTCSVTNMADNKSKKMIRSAKKNHQNAILVVCGCMSQNHQEDLFDLDIDILLGNKDKGKIDELLLNYLKNKNKIVNFCNSKSLEFEDMQVDKFSNQTRAYIKIQDGCNNYCTYCIIPYLRGNIRSKDFAKTINEAKILVDNDHKEIVLTGINTGSYGLGTNYDLVDLIEEMSKIEKLERIRISSIEITELNDKFLDMLKKNPKVCNHLHIPLQSGSEKILKLMNRKYDKARFLDTINKIREINSDISISTDVIVGFPSESENDFNECIEFCKDCKFSKIHVFPYSKREGTKACFIKDHLDNSIKKERSRKLIDISKTLEMNYNSKFINRVVKVLIEEVNEKESIGHTSNYLRVIVEEKLNPNTFYEVLITEVVNESVKGVLNN